MTGQPQAAGVAYWLREAWHACPMAEDTVVRA